MRTILLYNVTQLTVINVQNKSSALLTNIFLTVTKLRTRQDYNMFSLRYCQEIHSQIYTVFTLAMTIGRTLAYLQVWFQERVGPIRIPLTRTTISYFRKSKWKAINTHATATYGLILSPILLAFQHNPLIPLWSLRGFPWASGAELKIVGYRAREKVVAQINKRMTTSKDEKSKRALIVIQYRLGAWLSKCSKQQLKSGCNCAEVGSWEPPHWVRRPDFIHII